MKHVAWIHSRISGFSMTCGIQGCLCSYTNYISWSKHIQKKHKGTASSPPGFDEDSEEMEIDMCTEEIESNIIEPQTQTEKDKEKARWIMNTQSCTENILLNISLLCSLLVDNIKQTIGKQLQESGTSTDTIDKVLQSLDTSDYKQPFKGLETKYQQMSFFRQHLGYVVSFLLQILIHHYFIHCIHKNRIQKLIYFQLTWTGL